MVCEINGILTASEVLSRLGVSTKIKVGTASMQSESERWEKDIEHQNTISFYSTYISKYPNARILDLGAGAGKVAIRIATLDSVASVLAVDISLSAMKPLVEGVCQRIYFEPKLDKIGFSVQSEPWSLPYEDGSFDVVICRYAMHHFADQVGTVKEIARILSPGGLLLYSDPAMPEHSRDTTHGLYLLREDFFHGYRTYHEMLDLLQLQHFIVEAMRPYDYQRGTLDDYLKAAEPGLKVHLARAWCGLDEKTKRELKWPGKESGPFITYPVLDIAAKIQ